MEAGSIAKAVYDFNTSEPQELSLCVGDIVQVLRRIDKQWTYGFCNGLKGNFPTSFVAEVQFPTLAPNQFLFAPISDFVAQQVGDLSFKKGNLVVGLHPIDNNWWMGQFNENMGIFPLTHVWQIDKNLLPEILGPKKVCFKAQVKTSMKAQLPEEMDLIKDEIVIVTEDVGNGWFRGECDGKSGTFPATFVTNLADSEQNSESNVSSQPPSQTTHESPIPGSSQSVLPQSSHTGYDCVNSGISAYGRTISKFTAEYSNELSFKEGEIVSLIRHVDEHWTEGEIDGKVGLFPRKFIDVIVDCPGGRSRNSTGSEHLFPSDTYGRVLRDFNSETAGEPKLKEGDTVTLVRKLDHNWYEVLTDSGDGCICPVASIEVIGSGPDMLPPSYNEVMGSDPLATGSKNFSDVTYCTYADTGSGRPLSYPSTFNHSCDATSTVNGSRALFKVSQNINEKTAEDFFNLDTSQSSQSSFSSSNNNSSRSMSLPGDASFSTPNTSFSSSKNSTSPLNTSLIDDSNVDTSPSLYENLPNTSEGSSRLAMNEVRTGPSRPPLPSSNKQLDFTNGHATSVGWSDDPAIGVDLTDVKQQIIEKESQLKKITSCKTKLESAAKDSTESFVKSDLQQQISNFDQQIQSINIEIQGLKNMSQTIGKTDDAEERGALDAQIKEEQEKIRAEERKKKTKEQRACVVTEIIQTERDYIGDLRILSNTFLREPELGRDKGIDMATLFGNLDEVIDTASKLLRHLEKTRQARPENQMIGECFVDMAKNMKTVYGHYCQNHDDVNTVLEKYDDKSPAGRYLSHKVEVMKRQTNCFDLPSMLIKPVQRILKYPLLLNELVKCTEANHPDQQMLIQAVGLMTDVATAINEFKRKKDIVSKYRKQSDTSLSGIISKLSMHSVAKKSSRYGMLFSSAIGLKTVTKDENFKKVEKQFHATQKTIKIFMKDVNAFIDKTEELVKAAFSMSEDIAEIYQEHGTIAEVEGFKTVNGKILSTFWEATKHTLKFNVLFTLTELLKTFEGPEKLIQKRFHKLLDYDVSTNKIEKNKDVTKMKMLQEDQQTAKNTYEALNSQLLDDLPKLYETSIEIFRDCITCFLNAKKNFIAKSAQELIKLPLDYHSEKGNGAFLQTFQVKHNLVTENLSRLQIAQKPLSTHMHKRNSSPKIHRLSFGSSSSHSKSQTSNHQILVKSNYAPGLLYNACSDYVAADVMDLSLKKGDLVGVIKQQDPTGSRLRWFVDNGAAQGFVPAKHLVKFIADSFTIPVNNTAREIQHSSFGKGTVPAPRAPFSSTLPRNYQKSFSTEVFSNSKKQNPSLSKPLQPVRPAPPPYMDGNNVKNHSIGQQSILNNNQSHPPLVSQIVPNVVPITQVSKNNLVDSQQSRYEEIPDLRYDTVSQYEPTQTNQQSSSVSLDHIQLDDFDPFRVMKQVYDNVPEDKDSCPDGHRYEVIPEDTPDSAKAQEFYFAKYSFLPTGPNQLKVAMGQVVLVLHKCDLNRNPDWWFVEDREGNKGYVPGNYLQKYSTQS